MNRSILSQIKHAIKRRLDIKAGQIIESRGTFLSKRDLTSLITFMNKNKSYSYGVIRYIYYTSPYRHEYDPTDNNTLLCNTHSYPDIIELLWSDGRVVQEYITTERAVVPAFSSNRDACYAAKNVMAYGCSRAIQVVLKIVKSSDMLTYTLERAVCNGHTNIVRLLCEPQYFVHLNDANYRRAFVSACIDGYINIVRILLDACKDMDTEQKIDQDTFDRAMKDACNGGKLEIVGLLLRDGRSNPGIKSNLTIYNACAGHRPNASIVRMLLEDERVNPFDHSSYHNPILHATSFEIMRILFEDGRYDPKWGNEMIRRAMACFVGAARIQTVQLLLTDSRIAHSDLSNAIWYANIYSYYDVERILVAVQSSAKQSDAKQSRIEQKNIET